MRPGWLAWAVAAVAAVNPALPSQGQAGPVIQMDYSNPGLTPPHWTLILHPDGSGHFHSEGAATPPTSGSGVLTAPDQDRDIQMSSQYAGHVFQEARNYRWFDTECESHMKVSFQGRKKLSYAGPEGQGSCEFNYSKDKEIQTLGESLVAVANTVLEGARLELLLQHDRLGLDKEMAYITEAQRDGQVQQVCVIRGILERLAQDPGVMERVRNRARLLLGKSEE